MAYLLVVSALTLSPVPCRAMLGETMRQCVARYGPPTSEMVFTQENAPLMPTGSRTASFKKNGYRIVITFINGIVGLEGFCREDGTILSDREIEAILQADTAAGKWRDGFAEKGSWNREDGAAATYDLSEVRSGPSETKTTTWDGIKISGDGITPLPATTTEVITSITTEPGLTLESKAFHDAMQDMATPGVKVPILFNIKKVPGRELAKEIAVLKNIIELRQLELAESQIERIKKIDSNFDSSGSLALVNSLKLESGRHLAMARLLARRNKIGEALKEFEIAAEGWPGNPDLQGLAQNLLGGDSAKPASPPPPTASQPVQQTNSVSIEEQQIVSVTPPANYTGFWRVYRTNGKSAGLLYYNKGKCLGTPQDGNDSLRVISHAQDGAVPAP